MTGKQAYGRVLKKLDHRARTEMESAIKAIEDEDFEQAAELLRSTADLVEQQGNDIDHLNELDAGQEVLFNDRVEPCTVTEEARGNGRDYWHVTLQGPRGAYLKLRQEGDQLKGPNRRNLDDLTIVS